MNIFKDTKEINNDLTALKAAVKMLNDNYSLISDFSLDEVKDLIKLAERNVDIYSYFETLIMKRYYRDNGLNELMINNVTYEPQLHTKYRNKTISSKEYQDTPRLFVDLNKNLKSLYLLDFISYNPITHYGIKGNAEKAITQRYTYTAHNKVQEEKGNALMQVIAILKDNDITLSDLNDLLIIERDGTLHIDTKAFYQTYKD